MSFSMAPLLIHSPDVPAELREELRHAYFAPGGQRDDLLQAAARRISEELTLECADARELVGLPPCGC
jgi:hypothetical protein